MQPQWDRLASLLDDVTSELTSGPFQRSSSEHSLPTFLDLLLRIRGKEAGTRHATVFLENSLEINSLLHFGNVSSG
jgi:hypothetical protein